MGLDPISSATPNTTIFASVFNKMVAAIKGDVVPRNSSGIATNQAASLGTSTVRWLKAHIESGYWRVGDLKHHYSFAGAVPAGHGWMRADGRLINQANYDAEWGAGSWATFIGSSPIAGKFLPNVTNRYLVGSATTQNGATAIASVGNANNSIELGHTHLVGNHNHKWHHDAGFDGNQATYDASGNYMAPTAATGTAKFGAARSGPGASVAGGQIGNAWTSAAGGGDTVSSLGPTSIQPDSIACEVYMRII